MTENQSARRDPIARISPGHITRMLATELAGIVPRVYPGTQGRNRYYNPINSLTNLVGGLP